MLGGMVFPYPEHLNYFDSEIRPRLDAKRRYLGPLGVKRKRRLLAAPIPDPNDLARPLIGGNGSQQAGVSSFMPGPNAPRPTSFEVVLSHRFAKKRGRRHIPPDHKLTWRRGRRTVMRVMEEQLEPAVINAFPAEEAMLIYLILPTLRGASGFR